MAIADSCYGSELGDDFFTALHGLYKASGITPVELDNNRYENLCCGFATGIRNNWDHNAAGKEGLPKFKQIMRTGAKHVGVNCPGCWAGTYQTAKALNAEIKIHFAANFFLKALGDSVPDTRSNH